MTDHKPSKVLAFAKPLKYTNSPEWEVFEDHLTQALISLANARRSAPVTDKALDCWALEFKVIEISEDCPNFLEAQKELEGK